MVFYVRKANDEENTTFILIFFPFRTSPSMSTSLGQTRSITGKKVGGAYLKAEIVHKKGKNVLSDPLFNKGLAFPLAERDRLGIRGLIPPTT